MSDRNEPRTDPMLGDNGYPSEQELTRIREWSIDDDFRALMEYIRPRWEHYGAFRQDGDRFRLATGGWSGNEDIIGALEQNWMFQSLCALSWHTGGLYFYDVQEWDDNPEPGKRLRVRDPLTPMEDDHFVIGCDHDERAGAAPSVDELDVERLARAIDSHIRESCVMDTACHGVCAEDIADHYRLSGAPQEGRAE